MLGLFSNLFLDPHVTYAISLLETFNNICLYDNRERLLKMYGHTDHNNTGGEQERARRASRHLHAHGLPVVRLTQPHAWLQSPTDGGQSSIGRGSI